MEILDSVLIKFQQVVNEIEFLKAIGNEVECDENTLEQFDFYVSELTSLREILSSFDDVIPVNYLNNFNTQIVNLQNNIPYRENKDLSFINTYSKQNIKNQLDQITNNYLNQLIESVKFNVKFFSKLRFLSNNRLPS